VIVLGAIGLFSPEALAGSLPWSREAPGAWGLGIGLTALAMAGGLATTAFRLAGFAALIVALGATYGLALGFGLLARLTSVEAILGWPPAAWLGLVVVLAALAASWAAEARGEPAGRRRALRAVATLAGVTLAGVVALLPLVSHALAERVTREAGVARVHPSPDGRGTLVRTGGGGILVRPRTDPDPPPVTVRLIRGGITRPFWKPDGSLFAAWTDSGPLGLRRWRPALRIFDGSSAAPLDTGSAELPPTFYYLGAGWCRDQILALADEVGCWGRPIAIDVDAMTHHQVAPGVLRTGTSFLLCREGRCWWLRDAGEEPSRPRPNLMAPREIALYRITPQGAAAEPDLIAHQTPWHAQRRLSPSGRYWLDDPAPELPGRLTRVRALDGDGSWSVPLAEGDDVALHPTWIGDDLLAWITRTGASPAAIRVHLWRPGPAPPETHRLILPGGEPWIAASPDGRWILLGRERTTAEGELISGEVLVDRRTGTVAPLDEPLQGRHAERLLARSFWIDHRTLGTLYAGGPLAVRHADTLGAPPALVALP
jgi:hypothetical protein